MHILSHKLSDQLQTIALGQRLAKDFAQNPALILLSGALGAGKTTLAQAFISSLAKITESINSPSYSYMNSYERTPAILHFDLYRISSPDELYNLGLLDQLYDQSKIRLVEWPERFPKLRESASLLISLSHRSQGRIAELTYFEHSQAVT